MNEKSHALQGSLRWCLYVIYGISGACSLVYQIVWQRLLKLTIGNTTIATSITVAVFLGGLALGAWLARKYIRPGLPLLKSYAFLEFGIAIFALLSPLLFILVEPIYAVMFSIGHQSPLIIQISQILISSAILLVPTLLMGATLPLLTQLVSSVKFGVGKHFGELYAINTLGAFTGAAIAGFYGIRLLGLNETLYIAVFANFAIAAITFTLAKRHETTADHQLNHKESTSFIDEIKGKKLVAGALFISGAIALGYEILWMRTIVHFLRAEIYVFTSVLCVYLLSYAAGSYVSSQLMRKQQWANTLATLSFSGFGLCGIAYIAALAALGNVGSRVLPEIVPYLIQNHPSFFLHFFYSAVLFSIPSFLMGLSFPAVMQLWQSDKESAASTVGAAYALNAFGCVFGALLVGLVLIPMLGSQLTTTVLGAVGVVYAILLSIKFGNIPLKSLSISAAAIGIFIYTLIPNQLYLHWINMGEGRNGRPVSFVDAIEGINTTASVHRYHDRMSQVISSAGINVAGDSLDLRTTQKFQAHLPAILHGNPQRVLTVGVGSGELCKTLTYHDIPKIDLVEIAPEMVALSKKHFSHINLGEAMEDYIDITYMDAKNYLKLTENRYDIIMNDSIWPGSFAESSSLYTLEHFQAGKDRLTEHGVYSTWLPINIPKQSLRSIIKTFTSVFENTTLWFPHNAPHKNLLLVGQKVAHPYPYHLLENALDNQKVRNSIAMLNVEHINDLLDFVLAGHDDLVAFSKHDEINSDVYPVVEFDINRIKETDTEQEHLRLLVSQLNRVDYEKLLDFSKTSDEDKEAFLADMATREKANVHLFNAYLNNDYWETLGHLMKGLEIRKNDPDLERHRKRLKR